MKIRVLGAGAGGGYPQWNCNHPNSRRARGGDPAARPRTQSSIALSADGNDWVLCNASPDLRQQIGENSFLHPREGLRHSPIRAVVLTNADVDHIAGLLNLRESQPLRLHATERGCSQCSKRTPCSTCSIPRLSDRVPMRLDEPLSILKPDGSPSGVVVVPFAVPGKVALWLEDESNGPNFGSVEEDTIALEVRDASGAARLFYVPACARMNEALAARLAGAELVLFDGTLWTDDEMIRSGVGVKTGRRMGHMSISGDDGTMAAFAPLAVRRKVFIHINTTNPVLLDDSEERRNVAEQDWEVAYDGMVLDG